MHALPRSHENHRIPDEMAFLQPLASRLAMQRRAALDRPFVTLSYSQSIDGSVSVCRSRPCSLSCMKSLEMTHRLRALHDALLVGVNTVLSDDPLLTVRHCDGDDPQPVILDSRLRFPVGARLLHDPPRSPIIVTTGDAPETNAVRLQAKGARVVRVTASGPDGRVDLDAAFERLAAMGLSSVMIEGGATVIQRVLASNLVDYCIITIAPKIIGGVKAVEGLCLQGNEAPLSIVGCRYQPLGSDLVAYGPLSRA